MPLMAKPPNAWRHLARLIFGKVPATAMIGTIAQIDVITAVLALGTLGLLRLYPSFADKTFHPASYRQWLLLAHSL